MRRKWGIAAAVAALLAGGGYAAVRAVPGLVRDAAQGWVHDNLPGKVLTLGEIDFDLWRLTLDLHGVAIADARAPTDPLVAADAITIDASPAALWTLSPRLDRLAIVAPAVRVVVHRDGAINLAELLPKSESDEPLPTTRIARLDITGGRLRLTDERGAAVTDKRLTPISLTLKDLSTAVDEQGQARLDARGDDGEVLAWQGRIGLTPLVSTGRFSASGLNLATLARLAGAGVPVSGRGDIAGRYDLRLPVAGEPAADKATLPPQPQVSVALERLAISDAGLRLADGTSARVGAASLAPTRLSLADPVVALAGLSITDATARLPDGRSARLGRGELAGLRYSRADGTIATDALSLERISLAGAGRGAAPVRLARLDLASATLAPANRRAVLGSLRLAGLRGQAIVSDSGVLVPGFWPRPPVRPAAAGPDWAISLAGASLTDAAARLLVRLPGARPTPMLVSPLALTVGPTATPFARPIPLSLTARIDGRARLRLTGTASADGSADLAVNIADLPLARAAALAPPAPVQVRGGTLASQGRLRLRHGEPDFSGTLSIANLLVTERGSGDPLLGWGRLDLSGLKATPDRLAITRVSFDRLQSHVIVTRDQQLNLARVAGVPPADGEVELPPDADVLPETPVAAPGAPVVAQVAAKAVAETTALAEATAAPPEPGARGKVRVIAPISNTTGAAAKLIPISIGQVAIRRSTIDFTDQSIDPNFHVRIDGFAGAISNLDSQPGKLARFALKGFVGDRFAPASLTGRANPFAYDRDTDLTAEFRNIELPLFNPYSGRWAGYAIARGKLTTTIHWRIQNRALDAQHKIVIDQLKWGAATGSKDKVPLPVRLASSLLKDRKGVITLDLPVKGTLDNPKFRIWPIVWKIVGNVIGKVALAPFKLLGSLFGGGGEKAQYVGFAPGSAVLAPDSAEALGKIAKALADRTEVNLDIPAGPAGREDAAVLARQALETAVLRQKGGKPAAAYTGLDPDTRRDRLKALYKARLGKAPKPPEAPTGQDRKLFEADWMFAALLPTFAPGDLDLAELGKARADAVKTALLADGSVAPERVFINTALNAEPRDDKVRLELKIRE